MAHKTSKEMKADILKQLERADVGSVIAKALTSRNKKITEAGLKARNEHGKKALLEDSFYEDGRPRYTAGQYNALTDEDKGQQGSQALSLRTGKSITDAISGLASNLESIVQSDAGLDKGLAKLAGVEQILAQVKSRDRELLKSYEALNVYDAAAKAYKKGEDAGLDEKQLREVISQGSARAAFKRNESYGRDLAALAADLAKLAPSESLSNDQLAAGAESARKELKGDMEKRFGKDYENKVAKAVLYSLKRMVTSGDDEQETMGANLYYRAQRGYGIGERKLADISKK